jgi:DNA-binding transcriptional regulator GbsR (MarR family)
MTNLQQARREFIETWGRLGVDWGINRTMAQIHALLLVSEGTLDTEQVMDRLNISRGNANTNLRQLVDWGMVHKTHQPGVRREFFAAEDDIWEVARRIVEQRRRRELDPMMRVVEALSKVKAARGEDAAEAKNFVRVMTEIAELGKKAGKLLDLVLLLDRSSFFKRFVRLVAR